MERIFHHYLKWEDFLHGQYKSHKPNSTNPQIQLCSELLSDRLRLKSTMERVINEWKISSEVNLSHKNINRQAWLGQAACCLAYGASEDVTKQSWRVLDISTQDRANAVADEVISEWESRYA